MNGPELLEHAAGLVNRRRREYGEPVDLFEQIAQRWSLTLGMKVNPAQVMLCLIDLKLARLTHDPKHLDSQIDLAGYTACLPARGHPMTARRAKPNKVRGRQLEEVREKDPDGRIVYHHRTVDTLGKMLRAGTITPEMHDAAKDF
jgi:hypothetical protein